MSFFGKLANIFGMGDSDEVFEDSPEATQERPADDSAQASREAPAELGIDRQKEEAIFEHVVTVFNGALPDFLSRSVDPQKQRQSLYESLDASLKGYLESLRVAADENAKASWQAEHDRLMAEASALKKKASELEGAKSDIKDKQLSAERQRRALSERVRDLEEQVQRLEAEKEQYEIENKCMVNKAKASAVFEAEIEAMRNENQDLRLQVENLSQGAKVKDDVGDAMINELQAKAAEANANVTALKRQIEENAAAYELSNVKLEDAQKLVAEKEAVCQMLKSDMAEKDAQIKSLSEEVEELKAEIADDDETQREMEEIQKQIELFEQVKNKMDARIEKLKSSLQASQKENESLRQTIRENLIEHAKVQKELNDRISELDTEVKHKTKSISIDFTEAPAHPLADADWLLPNPPIEESMRVEDPADFGYKPPKIKPRIEADNYPSLFD